MSNAVDIATSHVSIAFDVCGGRPCVTGTRVRVSDVAAIVQAGGSVDEVLAAYPRLTLADVYGALAYYYDHRESIDQQADDEVAFADEVRQRSGAGPLEQAERVRSLKS